MVRIAFLLEHGVSVQVALKMLLDVDTRLPETFSRSIHEIAEVLETPNQPLDVNAPRLIAVCQDAEAIADGYLARAVTLPLAFVPRALTAATSDIARYRLYDDQIKEGGEGGKTPSASDIGM